MGIRTGKDYIRSLRDGRRMWIDGELVTDVTKDRRFAAAGLYDGRTLTCSTIRDGSTP